MPYEETHKITIGPISLPDGVFVSSDVARNSVTITGTTPISRDATVQELRAAFAALMIAATAEGVGQPVFGAPAPVPAPAPAPAPDPNTAPTPTTTA